MSEHQRTRRACILSVGSSLVGGCISRDTNTTDNQSAEGADGTGTPETDSDTSDSPGNCLDSGEQRKARQAESQPIEVTAEYEETDDLDQLCATRALDAAVAEWDRKTEMELTDPRPRWLQPVPSESTSGDEYITSIIVETLDSRTGYIHCPPQRYDIETATRQLPQTVTVSIPLPSESESHTCSHDIWLEERRFHQD